jgi:uncharacterized protein YdaU (DUF1376 family)
MRTSRYWMPLYVADYLGDTGHLSTEQHGAYLLLLFAYWVRGDLPDDDQQLANITRLPLDIWREHRPVLKALFHDGWKHKRVELELRRTADIRAKRALAGQKGGTVASINRFRKH